MDKMRTHLFVLVIILLVILACSSSEVITSDSAPTDTSSGVILENSIKSLMPANTNGAEAILIPGGSFWMGSENTDTLAGDDEMPRHQITLDGFYIYIHEVTNEMYADCVAVGACMGIQELPGGPTRHYNDQDYAEHPVVGVNWAMANDYCTWAGGRLPTEAEWELASRGTDSLLYPWGTQAPTCDRVNMFGCIIPPDSSAVGSFAGGNSPYQLWDMAGNVWEWVHDWYEDDYYFLSPIINPLGPYFGELKVVRGGGLHSGPGKLRTAERTGADPYMAYDDVGFRCVLADIQLPENYSAPAERREWVPPDPLDDDGEHVEDPDDVSPWFSMGRAHVSCPSPDGTMHIFVEVDSSEDIEYSVEVNGNPFECYYDEMLRGLQCEGPIPENNEELEHYTIDVTFNPGGPGGIGHKYPERPRDCPLDTPRWHGNTLASCPEGGWVTVTFETDIPITWDTVRLDDVDVACWPVSDTQLNCIVPERAPGENYSFYLRGSGIGADEWPYGWNVDVAPADDCPLETRSVRVDPICFEDHPAVQVMYLPLTLDLDSVSASGAPLAACIRMAPGVQVCGDLPGEAGSPSTVTVCFADDDCIDFPVTVPGCPATGTMVGYSITPGCYHGLGPVVVITYALADQPLVAANANGLDLACYDAPLPGWYMCSGIPGDPGSEMTITFCLADGTCLDQVVTVPACAGTGPVGLWNLLEVGCLSETRIYLLIDSPVSELAPGVPFDYSVQVGDGGPAFSCDLHPTIPGRIYCSGLRPDAAEPLNVCISAAGAADICIVFDDFAGRVPVCDAPRPDVPAPSCSSYSDSPTCLANGCIWTKGPPDGNYHCYAP